MAVVFDSPGGSVAGLAHRAADAAAHAGAELRVHELGLADLADAVTDVLWADAVLFATPTYFGNVSAVFKRFTEGAAPWWLSGDLADRPAGVLTTSRNERGGREGTIRALHHSLYHWGMWPVASPVPGAGESSVAPDDEPARMGGHLAALADRLARRRPWTTPPRVLVAVVPDEAGQGAAIADEIARGARAVGAQVDLRVVAGEPECSLCSQTDRGWVDLGRAEQEPTDLSWADLHRADAVVLGAPAVAGSVASTAVDCLQTIARDGALLRDKPAGAFVWSDRRSAESETQVALLTVNDMLLALGAVVVPPGVHALVRNRNGASPYGTCVVPTTSVDTICDAARLHGRRLAAAAGYLRSLTTQHPARQPPRTAVLNAARPDRPSREAVT